MVCANYKQLLILKEVKLGGGHENASSNGHQLWEIQWMFNMKNLCWGGLDIQKEWTTEIIGGEIWESHFWMDLMRSWKRGRWEV